MRMGRLLLASSLDPSKNSNQSPVADANGLTHKAERAPSSRNLAALSSRNFLKLIEDENNALCLRPGAQLHHHRSGWS